MKSYYSFITWEIDFLNLSTRLTPLEVQFQIPSTFRYDEVVPWKLNPAETDVCTSRHLDRVSKTGNRECSTIMLPACTAYVSTNLTCVSRVCFPFPFPFPFFYFFRDGNVEKSDQMRDGEADLGRHKARKGH